MTNYSEKLQLKGKVALVTGAAQGIGAEVVTAFGELGASVIISDRLVEKGEQLVAELQANGVDASFCHLDVTSEQSWQATIDSIEERYGRLDILVNNAGVMFYGPVEELSLDKFRQMQAVNVDGVFLGCKSALALMKKNATADNRASIINLSSMAGLFGSAWNTAYCTSKGAVRLMTKAMAAEFGAAHVRVNSVHPGLIQTDMGDTVQELVKEKLGLEDTAQSKAFGVQLTPLQAWGTVVDVAAAVAFLASNASNFMTATETVVDGGISGCQ